MFFEAVSNSISSAITEYGPAAVDAVLWVIRIDNLQKLILGFLVLICLIIYWCFFGRVLYKNAKDSGSIFNVDINIGITAFFSLFITIILIGTILLKSILDIWVWAGVIKPELWIAKQVVTKIENIANKK